MCENRNPPHNCVCTHPRTCFGLWFEKSFKAPFVEVELKMQRSAKYNRWWVLCVYLTRSSDCTESGCLHFWAAAFRTPSTTSGQDSGAGHPFDSPYRGHFDPQVHVAQKAIVLVSGFYVWCSPVDTQELETQQVSFLAFFPSFPSSHPQAIMLWGPRSKRLRQALYQPCPWEDRKITGCTHKSAST